MHLLGAADHSTRQAAAITRPHPRLPPAHPRARSAFGPASFSVSTNERPLPEAEAGRCPARHFRFLSAAAMAPLRCQLFLLPALALAFGPVAGLEAPDEAEELAMGMAAELRAAGLPGDLPELEPECRRLLAAFAEGSATLSGCLARRARPVRLCQACGGLYRSLLTQYGDIARAVGVRPTGRGRGPGSSETGVPALRGALSVLRVPFMAL